MQRQLEDIAGELREATARLHRLRESVAADRWTVRNDPARWSAAECIEHLNLTSAAMVPLLQTGIEQARRLRTTPSRRLRRDLIGWLLWKTTGPDSRSRVQTTALFMPSGTIPADAVTEEFARWQRTLLELTATADGLAIDRVKLTSPFNARMRYNVFAGFSIVARHQHRHLRQAERVWARA